MAGGRAGVSGVFILGLIEDTVLACGFIGNLDEDQL